jgi:putative exosortase-associated protein (TIGR04073 family)
MSSRARNRILGAVLAVGLLVVLGAASQAQADDFTRNRKDISLMFHKLGRGAVNIMTGWVEVPKNIAIRWKETDPFSGTVWGGIEGIGWGIARTLGGVYEVVSFPFPYPEDYEPLIEPEYILTPLWGAPAPFMTDETLSAAESFE